MKKDKKLKSMLITASLGIVSLFFINTSFASETGKVNVETANLREEANANSKILTLLAQDKEVEILEKSGDWYKIKADGITGYLRKDIVTTDENTSNTEQQQNERTTSENTQNTESVNAEETDKTQEQSTNEEQNVDNQSENEQETKQEITIGKYQIVSNTTIKLLPAINSKSLNEVKENSQVQVTEIINGWVSIETEEGKGWIRKEKIKEIEVNEQNEQPTQEEQQVEEKEEEKTQEVQETKTMYVNSNTVNLRKKADTTSEIVTTLSVNTEVTVIESTSNGWSKVKVNGKEGYIATSLLSSKKQETSRSMETPRKAEETTNTTQTTTTTSSNSGASVVATAKSYIGSSYVYGGSSPSGFDCSGFTSYVYKQFGITLNRTAAGQYSNGTAVSRSELREGDLVMFGKSGINHVGVYIGGGRMVHAANPSRGVTTDTINSGYYNNNYVGARRIF